MYLYVYVSVYVSVYVYVCLLADCRASTLRPIRDVIEAETHQAADVEVMEMHQCE